MKLLELPTAPRVSIFCVAKVNSHADRSELSCWYKVNFLSEKSEMRRVFYSDEKICREQILLCICASRKKWGELSIAILNNDKITRPSSKGSGRHVFSITLEAGLPHLNFAWLHRPDNKWRMAWFYPNT
jgi:hypothetical protein